MIWYDMIWYDMFKQSSYLFRGTIWLLLVKECSS
jgi:hypothetical protein